MLLTPNSILFFDTWKWSVGVFTAEYAFKYLQIFDMFMHYLNGKISRLTFKYSLLFMRKLQKCSTTGENFMQIYFPRKVLMNHCISHSCWPFYFKGCNSIMINRTIFFIKYVNSIVTQVPSFKRIIRPFLMTHIQSSKGQYIHQASCFLPNRTHIIWYDIIYSRTHFLHIELTSRYE